MRCFEALGAGCLLLSDAGNYPEGMADGETIVTYNSPEQAVAKIRNFFSSIPRKGWISPARVMR